MERLGEDGADLKALPPTRPPARLANASWALPKIAMATKDIATSDLVQTLTLALTFFINFELKIFTGKSGITRQKGCSINVLP